MVGRLFILRLLVVASIVSGWLDGLVALRNGKLECPEKLIELGAR